MGTTINITTTNIEVLRNNFMAKHMYSIFLSDTVDTASSATVYEVALLRSDAKETLSHFLNTNGRELRVEAAPRRLEWSMFWMLVSGISQSITVSYGD